MIMTCKDKLLWAFKLHNSIPIRVHAYIGARDNPHHMDVVVFFLFGRFSLYHDLGVVEMVTN
jgi:hypothetical protein